MQYDDFEDLIVSVEDGIGHFRLNRPQKMNALTSTTYREVVEVGRRFQADRDVRVVLCTHEGRGFSAGADINDPSREERNQPGAMKQNRESVYAIGEAMPLVEKPTTSPQPRRYQSIMKSVPLDPWSAEYIYRFPGKKRANDFEIISKGPDGQENTGDDLSSQDD